MAEDIFPMDSPDDPERCQGVNKSNGQCTNKSHPQSDFCKVHGANKSIESSDKESLRNYNLSKVRWKAQIEDKADSQVIKSIREEIGILRLLLEQRLEQCNDATDLMLHSQPIGELVMKINTLVVSCHKMEDQLGQLLDKAVLAQFASRIIDIIAHRLDSHPEIIEIVAEDITAALDTAGSKKALLTEGG